MAESQASRRTVVTASSEEAENFAADLLKTIICEAAAERGKCCIALSGGTTPRGVYQKLAKIATTGEVPWSAVHIFIGDERDVPHDHLESNYGMIQRTMLDYLPISLVNVHPMRADAADLDASSAEYEQTIRNIVPAEGGGLPRFDAVLLGMGGDGHVASLFPRSELLAEKKRLVASCFVPVLNRKRMTITFPLINAARNVVLLVTGDDKAQAVAKVVGDDLSARTTVPAGAVDPTTGVLFLVLDAAAGRDAGLRAY